MYAFHSATAAASNLYERGLMLRAASDLTTRANAALIIVDHFNKTGSGSGLDRISMSGVAEWVNSWMLLSHRKPADVAGGAFRLALEIGSRDWGGRDFDLDMTVGAFDDAAGIHDGQIGWELRTAGRRSGGSGDPLAKLSDELLRILADHDSLELTRDQLLSKAGGRKATARTALEALVDQRLVFAEKAARLEGTREVERVRYRLAESGESKIRVRDSANG